MGKDEHKAALEKAKLAGIEEAIAYQKRKLAAPLFGREELAVAGAILIIISLIIGIFL